MPSMTADDDHRLTRAPLLASAWASSPRRWQLPGVLRSDSPHAFAAAGPQAARITAPHPVDVPHGLDSPVGRVYELDGQVLLLGVDHTANTPSLGEYMRRARYRRKKYVTLLKRGRLSRFDYTEIDHCCQNFSLVDGWLESEGLQRRGPVGRAEAGWSDRRRCDPGGRKKFNRTRPSFSIPSAWMKNVMMRG